MMEIKIDKDVPMPEKGSRARKYPFTEMVVGDSFIVSKDEAQNMRSQMTAHNRRANGKKFTSRLIGDIVRVWRVE